MLSEPRPAKVGQWTEPALRVLRERYLLRKDGEVIETPEPVGKTRMSPGAPAVSVTAKFREYASAPAGIPGHGPELMSKVRIALAAMMGGPYAPPKPWEGRVSTTRQGAIAKKGSGPEGTASVAMGERTPDSLSFSSSGRWAGTQ